MRPPLVDSTGMNTRRLLIGLSFGLVVALCALMPAGCRHDDDPTLTVDLGDGVKMEFVRIPAGEFVMGSPEGEGERDAGEGPQHKVKLATAFYMGKYDVTQAQWIKVIGSNQSQLTGDLNLPADSISWGDCQKFCKYASKKTGRAIRLPTEAQWEYACRAGSQSPFNTGATLLATQANINGEERYGSGAKGANVGKTLKVGSYAPNAWGLYDMHGNVWEWCEDAYVDSYDQASAEGSVAVKPSANVKSEDIAYVYRGGSYKNRAADARSAIRYAGPENQRTEAVGFRVILEIQ